MVAILDFTKISKSAYNRKKMVIFVLEMKNNTQTSTLHDITHKIYFNYWKKLRKQAFSLKNGLKTCYLWRHIA